MQIKIGDKIQELRRRDGRKQEDLANALGVTNQAVSRWEANGSYPDLELLPAIANFFHVSIDELFGYHDDREEKIKEILKRASETLAKHRTMYQGGLTDDIVECANMLRAASEEFPNEPKILLALGQVLQMWGWFNFGAKGHTDDSTGIIEDDAEYNSKNIYWMETIRVYEKLLKSNPAPEDREKAIRQLAQLYCSIGEYEKAKALANNQNSIIICKEVLLPLATVGEEKARYQGERITNLLANLSFAISETVSLRPSLFSSEYGRQILLSVIDLYETVFIDGKCGFHHWDIGHLYFSIARYEAMYNGELKKALIYFDKAFEHYKEYERIYNNGGFKYSAPLVSGMVGIEKGEIPQMTEEFWRKITEGFPDNICNELRKNEKYAECFG
ncbi:MAG: helix-turn-helix transcriptional regulator [Clostridia bacterium]|nr:helix-turn-helix transcriptional regulator [Clostridia bacterium]